MGLGGGGGGINPISQPIFGLNPSPTESSNEEKGVKYAIFGGGTASKRAMRGGGGCQAPEQYVITGLFQYLIEMHLTTNYLKGFPK